VLSKLIEKAEHNPQQRINYLVRHHQNLPYPFCDALCGDLPNFENAIKAHFARDASRFKKFTRNWPQDRVHRAQTLFKPIWEAASR